MTLTPFPLGDFVERNLSWLGITPARIERLFKIQNCCCAARQSALNAWGFRVQFKIIIFVGGPSDMTLRERLRVVRKRLYRIWKTTTSK